MGIRVIKRNGSEVTFDPKKIFDAICKANEAVAEKHRLNIEDIQDVTDIVVYKCGKLGHTPSVEEIQDLVEMQLMGHGAWVLAKTYITYRYKRSLVRQANTTDDTIMSLIDCTNEMAMQENSNKNPQINSVMRDYMAGEVSKDLTRRMLLPEHIVEAHDKGIIHFHDSDYYAQRMHNCDLVNLEDMLQNGTVISGTMIERPHSFSTACNIATQIIAQVASNQYGGQSISLTHLAPFVQVSREKFNIQVRKEMEDAGITVSEEQIKNLVERRVDEEIRRGVQTIQYQVVTLLTTNGQAPFVTVFMYLGEAKNEQEKKDLAKIIEEVLKQRITGVKNESGVWVTPAFPKLIYVLEEQNIHDDSPYYYLTELAAKCTAKRMVPDYISEKKMLELKVDKNGEGHCYTCMGCRSFLTPYVDPETNKPKYYGRFNQGVVTINLVDAALSSYGDMDKFWKIFDERLELCHEALMCRHLDIVAKIMNKYLKMDLGRAVSVSGIVVALTSALCYDAKTVVLSVLGTYFGGIIVDHFIFGLNIKRRVCVISPKLDEITDFVLHHLHSGATLNEITGAYDKTPKQEIITIVDKNEYRKLMDFIKKIDPKAFVTVYSVNEIQYQPKV